MKEAKKEMKKGMLVKGKAAATPKGMEHNKKVMEKAGYSKKRAVGTAYGEVGMEKKGRHHESAAMKKKEKSIAKKSDLKKLKKEIMKEDRKEDEAKYERKKAKKK